MMRAATNQDWRIAAASLLQWWHDAGVDLLVEAEARDWTVRAPPPPPPAAVTAPALPDTLDAFLDWRNGPQAPEADWGMPMVMPHIVPGAGLLILLDQPEAADCVSGALLSGPEGQLLDRMLSAIGQSRESAHLVTLAMARHPADTIPAESEPRLGELALHLAGLLDPARLLLLGQATTRAVFGTDGWNRRGFWQRINHSHGTITALATWSPGFLLRKPAAKAETWKHLQLLIEGKDSA